MMSNFYNYRIAINHQAAEMVPTGITSRLSHITSPFGTFSRENIFKVRLRHIHKYVGRLLQVNPATRFILPEKGAISILSIRMHVKLNVYFINYETPNRSKISTTYL